MGMTFSDFCIKKTDTLTVEQIKACICDVMVQQGYTVAEDADTSDVVLAIVSAADGERSAWWKICSDSLEFFDRDSLERYVLPMAETLGSAVLTVSVFDSDALVLRLLDPAAGVDALAKAGLTKEYGISGRSNLSAWKPYVSDVKQFKKRLSEDHVFVEEILEEIAELLCLPASVSLTDYPTLTQMASPSCGAEYLYFKLPEKTEKCPPRLVWHCPGLLPQQIGEPQCFSFLNRGGASKGVSVCFTGPHVARDEIVFEDVRLTYYDQNKRLVEIPLVLEKEELSDGSLGLWADAPELPLPEAPGEDLPPSKYQSECFRRCISLRYTPQGDPRKVLDIELNVIPQKAPEGGIHFCVWKPYGSKEAYIEARNEDVPGVSDIPGYEDAFQKLRREDYD